MTNKIIEAARLAGQYADAEYQRAWDAGEGASWQQIRDARFYAIAYQQGLEDAAKVCDEQQTEGECPERASYCAEAIRKLKEQQHG